MTDLIFEDAEKLGFNRQRLDAIPAFFDSYLQREKLSGISILVAREGKVAHLSQQGLILCEIMSLHLLQQQHRSSNVHFLPYASCVPQLIYQMQLCLHKLMLTKRLVGQFLLKLVIELREIQQVLLTRNLLEARLRPLLKQT